MDGVTAWPVWLRRAFLWTLPISGPLYCLIWFVLAVIMLILGGVFACVISVYYWIKETYSDDPDEL